MCLQILGGERTREMTIAELLKKEEEKRVMKTEPKMKSTDLFQAEKVKTSDGQVWWVI